MSPLAIALLIALVFLAAGIFWRKEAHYAAVAIIAGLFLFALFGAARF